MPAVFFDAKTRAGAMPNAVLRKMFFHRLLSQAVYSALIRQQDVLSKMQEQDLFLNALLIIVLYTILLFF
jgi:hypothetical protein